MNALAAAFVFADTWDMHDWGAGWWVVMMLGMLLFWAVVIVGIVWVVRELSGGRGASNRENPIEVLEHRLAEGEISVEEFERRRKVLESASRT